MTNDTITFADMRRAYTLVRWLFAGQGSIRKQRSQTYQPMTGLQAFRHALAER